MIIYRLAKTEFCDLTGEGAKRYGGRWNLPGFPAVYGSSSISSALLERLTIDPELFAAERYVQYSVMEFNCPDKLITIPLHKHLPDGWDTIPPQRASQDFGTNLLQSGILCFGVPSVVDKSSTNFIINPASKLVKRLTWKLYSLKLDHRIIR